MIRVATSSDVNVITACVHTAYQHYIDRMGQKPGPMVADYAELVAVHSVFVYESAHTEFEREHDVEQVDPARKTVCGVLVMKITPTRALMDTVAVSPEWQGQGVGKSLIEFAESTARRLGYESLHLYTHELMIENINMYSALNYLEEKRVTESGFNRVYMAKSLVAS